MWERFELFWTAFEKFALFFSFLGTLTGLIFVAMIYQGVTQPVAEALPTQVPTPTPTPPAPPVGEIVSAVLQGFAKLEGTQTTVTVPISYTVPLVLEIDIDPESTRLELVGTNKVKANEIAIKFSDDVGWLVGKEALISFTGQEALRVKMNVRDQLAFDVPIRHDVHVPIPDHVDLGPEIEALEAISDTWHAGSVMQETPAD
jgi:hypothetical protein